MATGARFVAILSLLLLITMVANVVAVSMETDDNLSTYDDSEEDSFALIPDVNKHTADDTQESGHVDRSRVISTGTLPVPDRDTKADPVTGDPSSGDPSPSVRSNSDQLMPDLTQKPHSKPRSRKKLRKLETGRTAKKPGEQVLDLPASKDALNDVILSLKDQIRESQTLQTVTRSILNLVQEKQAALEEDLSFLKNEISTLHRLQSKDHDTIMALKDLVADNTWGVTSLVTSQEQLKKDVSSLKQEHDAQNATVWQLEDVVLAGLKRDESTQESIRLLGNEIRQLKERRDQDRAAIKQLKQLVTGHAPTDRRRHRQEHSNHIDQTSASELEVDVDLDRLGGLASALQEKHDLVEQSFQELSRKEAKLKQDMQQFSQKFSVYDTELSRVYTMFYNLSFQMSSLENKMLQQQQSRYDANLAELQQSLLNFTQHIYSLEQQSRYNPNSTGIRNQYDIELANRMIDSHQRRIELLEKVIHEHKHEQAQLHDLNKMRLGRMNSSMARFYKSFQDHHAEADDVFDFIDEKFEEFDRRIADNDHRLLRVEVRVLNASLSQCEKDGAASLRDERIANLEATAAELSEKLDDHGNLIDRLDHGMRRVFEDFGKQKERMNNMATEVKDVTDVIPQVSALTQEVDKLLNQLPQDCTDVLTRQVGTRSGVYLIKERQVSSSTEVFCRFRGKTAWTVVQRRQDGSTSFARDWQAYKTGFGSPAGEFWIGNENLHRLTSERDYLLRIEMTDLQDQFWWAEYDVFRIGGEQTNYRLHLGGYRGNATDALKYSSDMPFSTVDKDNDYSSTHCARFYTAGWWYKHCHYGNLNGRYTVGVVWFNHDVDEWIQLKNTVMEIRRLDGPPLGGSAVDGNGSTTTMAGQPELT